MISTTSVIRYLHYSFTFIIYVHNSRKSNLFFRHYFWYDPIPLLLKENNDKETSHDFSNIFPIFTVFRHPSTDISKSHKIDNWYIDWSIYWHEFIESFNKCVKLNQIIWLLNDRLISNGATFSDHLMKSRTNRNG